MSTAGKSTTSYDVCPKAAHKSSRKNAHVTLISTRKNAHVTLISIAKEKKKRGKQFIQNRNEVMRVKREDDEREKRDVVKKTKNEAMIKMINTH